MEGLGGISGPDVNTSIFPVGSCFTGCFSFVLIGVSEHSDSAPSFLINATLDRENMGRKSWSIFMVVVLAKPKIILIIFI